MMGLKYDRDAPERVFKYHRMYTLKTIPKVRCGGAYNPSYSRGKEGHKQCCSACLISMRP
jgi:hypothetical protein